MEGRCPVPVVACLSTLPCRRAVGMRCVPGSRQGSLAKPSVSFQAVSSCKSPPLLGQKLGAHRGLLFSLPKWKANL